MGVAIAPPDQAALLAPVLPALPAAAAATRPAVRLLPLLSPILRQRVQLLSESSSEPWLRLLCYDSEKTALLMDIARGDSLLPHPVSGEVEIDWGCDAETRYRRLDEETLQALVVIVDLNLAFLLSYCVGDQAGGGDGWRIAEVTVADKPLPFERFGDATTIFDAERRFEQSHSGEITVAIANNDKDGGDEDDDDYWGRYDATPGRTPAIEECRGAGLSLKASAEDEYYAQYDQVQPAMDGHDADQKVAAMHVAPPLGLDPKKTETVCLKTQQVTVSDIASHSPDDILSPRPESSVDSNVCDTVARLEESADRQEQNEFGVRQHVARTIRSLYMLSQSTGIGRQEFRRMVETEMAVLGMVEGDD
ncbi:hypothetical protein CP533_5853 [Ophiocordyceps camponoti-saundersi (nom. inval.)]|nr:hypothetical protein CP533_5853 [Ophiocordyceps camponoti-saundersi (nom. inval.)]